MTAKMCPTAGAFSSVTADTDWMWALGTTRKWVGAWGLMS